MKIFYYQVHTYACCNNCGQSDTSCDGKTYHGGSSERYCGSCGRDTWGGKYKKSFQCVNCNTQNACASRASRFDWPGGCWLWMGSFRGCCRRAASVLSERERQTTPLNITTMEFCGDAICRSNENPENCPMDCCYRVNSICNLSELSPECCGEQGCCMQRVPD